LLPGDGANSRCQNPAGDAWPERTSPISAKRRRQIAKTLINTNGRPFRLPWYKFRAGHGEISACFGAVNLPLPRASQDHPNSCCLNFFTASGGRGGISGWRLVPGNAHQSGCGPAALGSSVSNNGFFGCGSAALCPSQIPRPEEGTAEWVPIPLIHSSSFFK
jgi:hypothetical protein